MRVLPSGTTSLLVELDDLDAVLALSAALRASPPLGVVDLVPAARTVLLVADVRLTSLAALEATVRRTSLLPVAEQRGELVEVPVTYGGQDLSATAERLDCSTDELVRRHTAHDWRVAFCGFAPGFAYLTSPSWPHDVPRHPSPRVRVPPGSVALAGEFSGVYPQPSPGGWQVIGQTDLAVFDVDRSPAALLRPGCRVRFVEVSR
jgi:KipI family sensor histidine kinase inhibitor